MDGTSGRQGPRDSRRPRSGGDLGAKGTKWDRGDVGKPGTSGRRGPPGSRGRGDPGRRARGLRTPHRPGAGIRALTVKRWSPTLPTEKQWSPGFTAPVNTWCRFMSAHSTAAATATSSCPPVSGRVLLRSGAAAATGAESWSRGRSVGALGSSRAGGRGPEGTGRRARERRASAHLSPPAEARGGAARSGADVRTRRAALRTHVPRLRSAGWPSPGGAGCTRSPVRLTCPFPAPAPPPPRSSAAHCAFLGPLAEISRDFLCGEVRRVGAGEVWKSTRFFTTVHLSASR
jgi:hypothetical protein